MVSARVSYHSETVPWLLAKLPWLPGERTEVDESACLCASGAVDAAAQTKVAALQTKVALGIEAMLDALDEAAKYIVEDEIKLPVLSFKNLRLSFRLSAAFHNVGGRSDHVDAIREMLIHGERHAAKLDVRALAARPTVLRSLHRSLNSSNPGAEPSNDEARRQLVVFCNSLHHTQLKQPRPSRGRRPSCARTPGAGSGPPASVYIYLFFFIF